MSFKIKIISKTGKLSDTADHFSSLENFSVSPKLVSQTIKSVLSNYRSGNAHTKTRAEVSGGGKKPWRQKGTGRARHGSSRSPIWVGGGVVHGPRNTRNWHKKINKSDKLSTLKVIIQDRLISNAVYKFDDNFSYLNTKNSFDLLNLLSQENQFKIKNFLVLYSTSDKENLRGFVNTESGLLNVCNLKLDILVSKTAFILTPNAINELEKRFNI